MVFPRTTHFAPRTIVKIASALLCLAMLPALAAAAEGEKAPRPPKEKALVVKVGYFTSNETERAGGEYDLSYDASYALAMEYFKVWRNDFAFSVSALYSEPGLSGTVWDATTNTWVPAAATVNVRQVAVNYIKFGDSVRNGIDKYVGGYYGAGIGFSSYSVDNALSAFRTSVIVNQGVFEENTADFNLLLGYKFANRFGVDAKWIFDKKAFALFGDFWY